MPSAINLKSLLLTAILVSTTITQNVQAQGAMSSVKVDVVTFENLGATTELMGTIYSRSHIPVTANIDGQLEWLAEPGDEVKAGQVIVNLDKTTLSLLKAEQKALLNRAQINDRYLTTELKRLQELKKTNATSQVQLDQMQSESELAKADIEIAKVKLAQIEDQLQKTTIKAPFTGIITERLKRSGSEVNRGESLLQILDTENLEIHLYVPVKYLPYVAKGEALTISDGDRTAQAVVNAKIPRADPRSQTFEIRLTVPESFSSYWAAGQLISVQVPVQDDANRLTLDRDALILRTDGTYVMKIASDNKVQKIKVDVKHGTKDRVSVAVEPALLAAGDKVAKRGAERLYDGQEVSIQQ